MTRCIDLNSDLGEQPGTVVDEEIMPYISSCNVAGGGHTGNAVSVWRTVELAAQHQVKIGAHPSFPDRENFGRKVMPLDNDQLVRSFREQVMMVKDAAEQQGHPLNHVKPHGALYSLMADDEYTSAMIIQVIKELDSDLTLYGMAHSATEKAARTLRRPFVSEAFVDRRYEVSGKLRDRKFGDAVIHDEAEVLEQASLLVFHKCVKAGDTFINIRAQTLCLHSDTKGSVNLAKAIHHQLVKKGATITAV